MSLFANGLNAQSFQDFASFYKKPEKVKTGELTFRFESLGFFENNEYMGNIVKGYTLTGVMLRPKFTYSPADGLYVEAGVNLLKYNGKDTLMNSIPWFSARYCFSDKFSVVTGNLDQTNHHGLPEQLWEPERMYTDKPDAGLQFIYSASKLNAQTWVNWEQFIQKGDTYQEYFTAGVTGSYELVNNRLLKINIPCGILFYHHGGEINVATDGIRPRVQTHSNVFLSSNIFLKINRKKLKSFDLQYSHFGYTAITTNSNTQPYKSGHANFIELGISTLHSRLSLGKWNAFQFIAPKGRAIYQSVSEIDPSFNAPKQSMLTAKYFWQKNIALGARVAFQVEAYLHDLPMGSLSYSYGFFLLVSPEFLIKVF